MKHQQTKHSNHDNRLATHLSQLHDFLHYTAALAAKGAPGYFKPQSLIRYVLHKLESFHSFTSTAQTVCRQASTQHAAATRTNSKMGFPLLRSELPAGKVLT